jgi:IS30 family transposase
VKPSSYKPFAKLNPVVVVAIRESSATRNELALQLKVHRSTVSRAARRRTWRDVP